MLSNFQVRPRPHRVHPLSPERIFNILMSIMTPEELHEGIFNLHTRRFGTVAEVMIKRLAKLGKNRTQFHDLFDDIENHRIEVKFSTVRRKNDRAIKEDTVLQCIKDEAAAMRQVKFSEWKTCGFDCNIQQIKCAEFEYLYYGLFFQDCILIFRIASDQISKDMSINYSDWQHKGNDGEGQFHINPNTLQHHLDTYKYKELTYAKLLNLLT